MLHLLHSSLACLFLSLTSVQASLKGQCHEIFCFWFFLYESVSPQPQIILLGPFRICLKISRDIGKSRCTRYQRHRRQILPPVSLVLLIPVANLPPNSTSERCPNKIIKTFMIEDFFHFVNAPRFSKKFETASGAWGN
jgi:hypothetical protein